ncbi:hypothetical protein F5B18DRAFT_671111 [Nemania serpens]|nr:hypothetical protein F5B18DRAFT_671111 [Nemania serpens]
MWAIGGRRAAALLNYQIAFGREIVVWEDVNLFLVWNSSGKIFIKPLPRFLLDSDVWRDQLRIKGSPPTGNTGSTAQGSQQECLRSCALGFSYTYVCLVTHESDFVIEKEKRLLPLPTSSRDLEIEWDDWKHLVRDNVTWLVTATVFIALVLTALQVGLATQELKENVSFSRFVWVFCFRYRGSCGRIFSCCCRSSI